MPLFRIVPCSATILLAIVLSAVQAQSIELNSLIAHHAPQSLALSLRESAPVHVKRDGKPLTFTFKGPGVFEHVAEDLITRIRYDHDKTHNALRYQIVFENRSDHPIGKLSVDPLHIAMLVDRPAVIPRVRYLTGSKHYDATYPSRAFEIVDRAIMTTDHATPIKIGGGNSRDYVQMMQVALQRGELMSGFMASFEWSGPWAMKAGYAKTSWTSEPISDFEITGEMTLGDFVVPPHATLSAPAVHVVYFTGDSWAVLDNAGRRYIRERIAYARPPKARVGKVTYDHWFGIHSNFDIDMMMAQAKKAAELGCEYFCLDAGWYGKGAFGASGKGEWNKPDPVKFPGGVADVQRLSAYCREQGMGFGLWAYWALKNAAEGEQRFKLETVEGVDAMVAAMKDWIDTYDMTWFRFEMAGSGDLNYRNGYYQAMDHITKAYPHFHIECCLGGGQRFDLGMIRWCTSTWLSDHTANAAVCRNTQSGALRFWPSHFLNSAIRVHRNAGDQEATIYNFISRMIGAPSFNGDIAQWSDEATARMRRCVDIYKSIRHLQDDEPVFFPLPQVQTLEDWDVIVYGDGTGEGQLMYVFNTLGPSSKTVQIPGGNGAWEPVLTSRNANASAEPVQNGWRLHLNKRSAAVFRR